MTERTEQPVDSGAEVGPIPPILAATLGMPVVAVLVWFVLQFWKPRRGAKTEDTDAG